VPATYGVPPRLHGLVRYTPEEDGLPEVALKRGKDGTGR
jgi:hypothetical protein